MRLCVQEGDGGLQGAYFASALFCIQRSKGSEPGSYPDSSESQAGLCILLFPRYSAEEEEDKEEGG